MLAALGLLAPKFCIYDRAAILQGELWRAYTGHFVHFSTSHFLWDALILGVAIALLEKWKVPGRFAFLVLAPLAISLAMLVFEPNLEFYGGLSGIGIGAVTMLGLHGFRKAESRWLPALILAAVTLKCATPVFHVAEFNDPSIRVAGISHIGGACFAAIVFATSKLHCLSRRGGRLTFSAR